MDPYTVTRMVQQRQSELLAEAARERLAPQLVAPRRGPGAAARLRAAIRSLQAPGRSARIERPGLETVR